MLKRQQLRLYGYLLFALILGVLGFNTLFQKSPQIISPYEASHFDAISDPVYQGRSLGSEGHKRFEETLISHFTNLKIPAFEADYRHPFNLNRIEFDKHATFTIGDEASFKVNEDYMTLYSDITGPIDYQGDLILLERNYFSIDPDLIKGKVVVSTFNRLTDEILDYAINHEVKGLLVLDDYNNLTDIKLDPYYGKHVSDHLYIGEISSKTYMQLRNIAKNHLFEGYEYKEDKPNDPISGTIPNATLSIKDRYPVDTGQNIIGKIDGKSDQYVCFYTTYDGIGQYQETVYNSELVHLSGTEVLMNLMSYCAGQPEKPDKTIYFAFVDAGALGNQGAEVLSSQLPQGGEFINLGIFGIPESDGLILSSKSPLVIQSSTESSILSLRLFQYLEALNIPVTESEISNHDSAIFLSSTGLPSVKIAQSSETYAFIGHEMPVSDDALEKGTNQVIAMVANAYFEHSDYTFIPLFIRLSALLLYILIVLMLFIRAVFKWDPEFKWLGYEIYLSTPYMLLTKLLKVLLPTIIMITIVLFILLMPSYITKTHYNGGYTNYVFNLHAQRVVHYLTQVFTDFNAMIPASLKTSLWVSFKNSIRLFSVSIMISLVIGLSLGIYMALKPRKIMTLLQMVVYSIPDVLLCLFGLLSIIWLVKHDALGPFTAEQLRITIVPTIIMCIAPSIYISRMVELNCSELLDQPFVFGAIARGVSFGKILFTHILPMLLASLFSTMTSILRIILVNLIIVEFLFSSVGIGAYLIIKRSDPTYVLLISVCLGLMYFIANTFFRLIGFIMNPLKRRAL